MDKIEGLFTLSAIPTVELIDDAYALCEDETLKVVYCNPVFIVWFNIRQAGSLLDEAITSLKKDTLFKRIDKRGYYSLSIETDPENKKTPSLIEIKFQPQLWLPFKLLTLAKLKKHLILSALGLKVRNLIWKSSTT
jgi:hypothetical protein